MNEKYPQDRSCADKGILFDRLIDLPTYTGILGEKGIYKEATSTLFTSFKKAIKLEMKQFLDDGFHEIDIDDH